MTFPRNWLLLAILAIFSLGTYLLLSQKGFGPGFPLDDAWIHQSYARNLGSSGEWAFLSGTPSAGATSILWVLLLVPGYWFSLAPFIWSFLMGGILLFFLSIAGWWLAESLGARERRRKWIVALVLLFEWHMVWAAGSGMETLLFALLVTLCLGRLLTLAVNEISNRTYWIVSGALIGIASLTRPEGVTLLAPFSLLALIYYNNWINRLRALIHLSFSFSILFSPFLILNKAITDSFWPNTFYAKQAEFSILLDQSFATRFIAQLELPLVGIGLLLLPGFVYFVAYSIRERNWTNLLVVGWAIGHLALFAMRLPVVYQHGRYAMPMIPIYIVIALVGLLQFVDGNELFARRVPRRVWLGSAFVVHIAFWWLGARAYTQDVAFIETQMVATADWLDKNLAADASIGVHDIGAIGYFSERKILDLAGLISPEVIPFIRDEGQLANYLDLSGTDYLVTFPGWYPQLTKDQDPLFVAVDEADISYELGPMTVYSWQKK